MLISILVYDLGIIVLKVSSLKGKKCSGVSVLLSYHHYRLHPKDEGR